MRDPKLWTVLSEHPLPVGRLKHGILTLVIRLGRLGKSRAQLVVREYRRFLYLAAVAGAEVVPPPVLDRVWKAHARDHAAYLEALVRGAIRRPMPEPFDAPRPLDDPAHRRTREIYREEFGVAPPPAIWPGAYAMVARRVLDVSVVGLAVLAGLLILQRELAWAVVAGAGSLSAVAARHWLAPWVLVPPSKDLDLDFGSQGQGGGIDLFGDD